MHLFFFLFLSWITILLKLKHFVETMIKKLSEEGAWASGILTSAKNMFIQDQLTARHWRWVLLLVWYLCCTEASIRPLYEGLCSCTYSKCHPNLLCKIILRKVWESQKTNANRELCRHNPRAAFDCSICLVRCLLRASSSLELSDLLLCSYACNKLPALLLTRACGHSTGRDVCWWGCWGTRGATAPASSEHTGGMPLSLQ